MSEYPVKILRADKEIHSSAVLNKQSLNAYLYIEIPPYITQNCVLYEVSEICPKFIPISDYNEFIKPNLDKHPWLDVKTDRLNLDIGLHVYDLGYVNPETNATFSLYFSYILQDNDPSKPYIYMDRED